MLVVVVLVVAVVGSSQFLPSLVGETWSFQHVHCTVAPVCVQRDFFPQPPLRTSHETARMGKSEGKGRRSSPDVVVVVVVVVVVSRAQFLPFRVGET